MSNQAHPEPAARYPASPGHRNVATSVEAAEALKPSAKFLQDRALEALRIRPMTSWEVAQHLGVAFEAVQPRCSELLKLGLVTDSGDRGPARSPKRTAIRWKVTERGQ